MGKTKTLYYMINNYICSVYQNIQLNPTSKEFIKCRLDNFSTFYTFLRKSQYLRK